MLGKTINGFTLQRLLGTGGMAEVWYAENEIHKAAAVKILNEDLSHNANIVERFRNEAEIMVKLDHPNIRQVFGYGSIDGRPAIVMEYLDGADLKARMKSGQRFTQEELVKWWNQLVDALNYTHQKGVVHRDIKPGNIFVDKAGNVKLLDFGIAKVRDSISSTQTGQKLGTLMYMSPEQVRDSKHLDYHTDLYSLAVTFVHLLSGRKPYDSDTSSDFDIQLSIVSKPLDLSGVAASWQGFLAPYLEKEPAKRPALKHFETMPIAGKELGKDDDATVCDAPQPQPKTQPSTKAPQGGLEPLTRTLGDKPKSKKGLWIGLGIAAVAVATLVAILLLNNKGENGSDTNAQNKVVVEQPNVVVEQPANGDDLIIPVNSVNITMKSVAGGTFQMGSDDSEADSDEKPVHSVTVSTFYMGETEVTQALWKAVMGTNPSYFKGDNLPVEQVSWNDCQDFIRKLNQLTGMNFRLPTEAEWEYAARGGNQSNGYKYAGSNNIGSVAWYADNSGTHAVKGKSPNELGLYDMSGNVYEWCSDWKDSYSSGSQTNPKGPSSGSGRVLRGGSWASFAEFCRVSNRSGYDPDFGDGDRGFRLVLPQ